MKWTTVTIFYKKWTHLITLIYSICLWFRAYIKGKHKQSFCQMHLTTLRSISTRITVPLQMNAMSSESHLCPSSDTSFEGSGNKKTCASEYLAYFFGKIKNKVTSLIDLCITVQLYQKDTSFAILNACARAPVWVYTWENLAKEAKTCLSYLDQDTNLTRNGELQKSPAEKDSISLHRYYSHLMWSSSVSLPRCLQCLCLPKQPAEQTNCRAPLILDAKSVSLFCTSQRTNSSIFNFPNT